MGSTNVLDKVVDNVWSIWEDLREIFVDGIDSQHCIAHYKWISVFQIALDFSYQRFQDGRLLQLA